MRRSSSLALVWRATVGMFLVTAFLFSRIGYGKDAKILRLSDTGTATVVVSGRGTV